MTNARQTRKGHKLERHNIELHELEWDTVYKKDTVYEYMITLSFFNH